MGRRPIARAALRAIQWDGTDEVLAQLRAELSDLVLQRRTGGVVQLPQGDWIVNVYQGEWLVLLGPRWATRFEDGIFQAMFDTEDVPT